MAAPLTWTTATPGTLVQLGYGSGIPGSPYHVPGIIYPGDGTGGLTHNDLVATTTTRGTLTPA